MRDYIKKVSTFHFYGGDFEIGIFHSLYKINIGEYNENFDENKILNGLLNISKIIWINKEIY